MTKKSAPLIIGSVILTIIVVSLIFLVNKFPEPNAQAQGSVNEVTGYAWSSNIGWISFNKVTMDASGNLSGYAWSSNIGWIKTNPASEYPEAPNTGMRINVNDGTVSGWMRACNGAANRDTCSGSSVDGWDGWIKITNAKVSSGGFIKDPTDPTGQRGGWAWGGDVVGWVQFYNLAAGDSNVTTPHVDCDFTATPSAIILPQVSVLNWSCNSYALANKCAINNGVGSGLVTTGSRTVRPAVNTTYTLTCEGFGGPLVKTAGVTVGSISTTTTTTSSTTTSGTTTSGTTTSGTTTRVRIIEVKP